MNDKFTNFLEGASQLGNSNITSTNDFTGLINATKKGESFSTKIEGHVVTIIPNFYSDRDLCSLYINKTQSNSCMGAAMRKLLREWQAGKRHVVSCESGMDLLMKKY